MRTIPETANRADWPRLVAQTVNAAGRAISDLQAPQTARTVTATGPLMASDYLVLADATAGAVTLTLPAAAASAGSYIITKKIDASVNTVTVDGDAAETIDGAATVVLTAQYDAVTVFCDGAGWFIV